jgi:hypothetical protein
MITMNLAEAVDAWTARGWHLEARRPDVAVLVYDDRGQWIQLLDHRRSHRGRAALYVGDDGRVRSRLLSKFTTDPLHWLRYLGAARTIER